MSNAETIRAVQRLQDYMEENLNKSVTLKELANVAGYSPWHIARGYRGYIEARPVKKVTK